jgi:hypothetical protein
MPRTSTVVCAQIAGSTNKGEWAGNRPRQRHGLDYDELERSTRVGYERGMAMRHG